MIAHVICRVGSLVELEVRRATPDSELDRTVLDRLKELAQAGAEMQCRLYLKDAQHLVIQLDEPHLP